MGASASLNATNNLIVELTLYNKSPGCNNVQPGLY